MNKPMFLLVKAQILRETLTHFDAMRKGNVDPDYVAYLRRKEVETIESFTLESQLDEYLRESRRLSLDEWLESLDWKHCSIGI